MVQLGFVLGTLTIAVTDLVDIMNTHKLFAISAVMAGVTNAVLVFLPDTIVPAMALRVRTGVFLGGVYPPG